MPSFLPSYVNPWFPNTFNLNPSSNLVKFRKALARVKNNAGNCRILCIGDSTTLGVWSNGTQSTGDEKTLCFPTLLSNMFNAVGINSHWNSFFGFGSGSNTAPNNGVNDPRITLSGSMGFISADMCPGGVMFEATAAGNLAFRPTVNVDTFNIWGINVAGSGVISLDVNGAGATTFSQAGASVVLTYQKTATLGANTLNAAWNSGGKVFVIGMEAYDSSKSWVSVMNAGWSGSTSGNWNSAAAPWTPKSFLASAAASPDLTLICLGINDWFQSPTGSAIAAYIANIQALITAAKNSGDVVLVSPVPSGIGTTSAAVQQLYVNAMYQLAAANNIPLIDNFGRWVSFANMNAAPTTYGDFATTQLHPNGLGYNDFALGIFKALVYT